MRISGAEAAGLRKQRHVIDHHTGYVNHYNNYEGNHLNYYNYIIYHIVYYCIDYADNDYYHQNIYHIVYYYIDYAGIDYPNLLDHPPDDNHRRPYDFYHAFGRA